jgi:outer membrane cobalamin receptor
LIVCVPLLAGLPVAAETVDDALPEEGGIEDFEELDLEELLDVVFTASKHRQSIFWSPSAITVFTREDIRTSGAADLADLLRRVPGFDVYRLKPSFPLVGARALTTASNNLILLLVDGREAVTEVSGFALWSSMTIDMDEVERVEVIRGPGSALYGANAFAAVVSITTVADKPPDGGDVLLSAGEKGRQRLFGRVRHTTGLGDGALSFGVGLGAERKRSPSDVQDEVLGYYRSHAYLRYREGRTLDLSLHAGAMFGGGIIYIHIRRNVWRRNNLHSYRRHAFLRRWQLLGHGQVGIRSRRGDQVEGSTLLHLLRRFPPIPHDTMGQ